MLARVVAGAWLAITVASSHAAESAVFIDIKDQPLPEAAEFVGRITQHHIMLGPGAAGRITMSSPRALTYDEVLIAFDAELKRNGMVAIKRGREMLIVADRTGPTTLAAASASTPASASNPPAPAQTPAPSPAPAPTAGLTFADSLPAVASASPTTLSYVASNLARARSMIARLLQGGITARLSAQDADPDAGYTISIEVPSDAVARATLAKRLADLDLSALFDVSR